ncbi:putative membrane protein [Kineococcus xinjiangensis]|uniref:Putative membrane protein n=1 Tax=Kineococcus xinjiangensis TaxID=512762 RepID=A0A2S6IGW6_9ACTN|nr:putative membrane protein [Kineococcus xinjiangensis]
MEGPAAGEPAAEPPAAEPALERVDPGSVDPATRQVLADPGWQRLHPVTPLLRGWKTLAVIFAVLVHQNFEHLLEPERPSWQLLAAVGGGIVLLTLLSVVWGVLAWRRTRYRIDAEAVHMESGVLFRQQRRAQLDRLQAVDVVRPLLGRLAGLAELRLEVAGGAGGGVRLAYLKEEEAQRVRNALLAAAAGVRYAEGEEAPEAPERPVVEVPVQRLLLSMLFSGLTVWVLVAVAGAVAAVFADGGVISLAAAAPLVLGALGAAWQRFTHGFGFSVAESPDGLRVRRGLLELRSQTVPPGRVQALRISQPLLWRRPDWWRVHVNVAGYAVGVEAQGEERLVLPVGTREELARVLAVVLPDLGTDEAPIDVVSAGLTGRDRDGGFTPVPPAARWLDPLARRRLGFRVTERAFLSRGGVLRRYLDVVPHERTQSLALQQGPWQRRLGLASVSLHSTPGPVAPQVRHLAAEVAAELLQEQSVRARTARAAAGPERWMERGTVPPARAAAPVPGERTAAPEA